MTHSTFLSVFHTWRDLWTSTDGVSELLVEADRLLERRSSGNQCVPHWTAPDNGEKLALGICALRAWANGEPPKDPKVHSQVIRHIYEIIQPLLHAAIWPRWLLLERAFLDSSATGDLLFAALTLRTMCEEVQRLHALDLDVDRLAQLAASNEIADQERFKLFLSVALVSLDTLPEDMILQGKNWPNMKPVRANMPELEKAQSALNAYVHPNYGSHISALFPESTAAAQLLLEAIVAVYKTFFTLSWAEQPVAGPTFAIGVGTLDPWQRLVENFQSHIVPEIQQRAAGSEIVDVIKISKVIEWLTRKRDDFEDILYDLASGPMLKDFPRWPKNASADGAVLQCFRMWDGARAIDLITLASARNSERLLAKEFPSGAPDSADQVRWLRFNAQSIGLAMLLDQVKVASFKTQLVRQITQGNSLGILLCVRSLIEHRALASWLPQKVRASLTDLADQLHVATPLPENAVNVEQPLANFLTAQAKESREDHRSWIMRESGGTRIAWLNLGNVVNAAFSETDYFRHLYAFTSGAMHGRTFRGCELMLDETSRTSYARSIGMLVLERLCDGDEEMDHLATAFNLSAQLDHAANFGGTSAAETDIMAQQVFDPIRKELILEADYTGEGTADDPFQIGSHLQFYQASYKLLGQLGVDVANCPRGIEYSATGYLCDRWRAPDRDYWFLVKVRTDK